MAWDVEKSGRWILSGAVVAAAVLGAVALVQPSGSTTTPAPTTTTSTASVTTTPRTDPTAATLTFAIAEWVWEESWTARDTHDAARYEASTCETYIYEQKQLRGIDPGVENSTADLLAAFEESKQYRPPWAIEDTTLIAVEYEHGDLGWLRTTATVTDNRVIPPVTDRREIVYEMTRLPDLRWKLCPSMAPLG